MAFALAFGSSDPAAAPQPSPQASPAPPKQAAPRWAAWIEPEFPFFSSVLDARRAGPGFPANNVTPRGLVVNLGQGYWVAFDVDLLRVAALWRGNAVTPRALAPGSYQTSDKKTPGGQFPAPEPDGTVWMANGIYPGWQSGPRPSFDDPREPAPSPQEVGRGPLSEQMGRFKAIRQVGGGVVLEYTAGGAEVREWLTLSERKVPERHVRVGPSQETLWLLLGIKTEDAAISLGCATGGTGAGAGAAPVLETFPFSNQGTTADGLLRLLRLLRRLQHRQHLRHLRHLRHQPRCGPFACRHMTRLFSSAPPCPNAALPRRPRRARSRPPSRRRDGRVRSPAGSRARPRRTRMSWTTSRCRSTIPGAATCD